MSCLTVAPYTFIWCEVWSGKLSFTHILILEMEPEELTIFRLAKAMNPVVRDSQSKAALGWQKHFVLPERKVCSSGPQSTFFLHLQKCVVSLQWRSNAPQWWLNLQRKVTFLLQTKNKLQEKQATLLWEREEITAVSFQGTWWCISLESLHLSLIHGSTILISLAWSKTETSLVRKGFRLGQGDCRRRQDLQGKRKRSNDQMMVKIKMESEDAVLYLTERRQHTVDTAQLSKAQAQALFTPMFF